MKARLKITGLVIHAQGPGVAQALGIIRDALVPVTADEAYKHGFDAGKNEPNTTNTAFVIFSCTENTRAWERGYAAGVAEKVKR